MGHQIELYSFVCYRFDVVLFQNWINKIHSSSLGYVRAIHFWAKDCWRTLFEAAYFHWISLTTKKILENLENSGWSGSRIPEFWKFHFLHTRGLRSAKACRLKVLASWCLYGNHRTFCTLVRHTGTPYSYRVPVKDYLHQIKEKRGSNMP